ncbi:rap guanine nucleotide exchange factor 2-like isoform X1 [Drosophila teissieri]|uniref:rap guanine nucleotide exchange factor 2-like isoform X1 n=1 Tax=Drosophila teissieri TaxID=7243 RepID=UPI001CBA4C43|nr:rap guanine nucleotide exchange factor 2-like isoform X1 [Drosophila teissieri]XP_043654083.1 rap guanine nucleotide exchange factor 2-like isoform X1 [Drosophila teissieri]
MDPYHHIRHHYPPTSIAGTGAVVGSSTTINRPELHQKCNRGSHSSDTSSAYSGSDTMASNYASSLEAEEIDLSGLVESVVDSDEEDLAESMDSLTVRDAVRDCLEKDPAERSEEDVEVLLEFTQGLKAFTNITLAVRRALCSVMVFAVVDKAGTVVMSDGEELDSWSVLINGAVEIEHANGSREELQMGDSFGILPTMDKLYHRGVMRTKCDDCQFVCITQTDYYRIQHQGEENTRRHEDENGFVVMVTELRSIGGAGTDSAGSGGSATGAAASLNMKRGHVVIRGTPERLLQQLVEENSMTDPTYVEDFLLTHRIFIQNPQEVTSKLLHWFDLEQVDAHKTQELRDRVTRVVLLWVNNHFTDFEADYEMMEFLEVFEALLERKKLLSQLRLLHIACAAKARMRSCTLTRSSRDEPLNFRIVGGYELRGVAIATGNAAVGIYISHVESGSKAQDVGLKRGDQIHEVNGQSLDHVTSKRAHEILTGTTHLSISVKSNLLGFKEIMQALEHGGGTAGSGSISAGSGSFKTVRSPRRICANDIAKLHGRSDSTTDELSGVSGSNRAHMVRLSSVDMLLDQPDCAPPQTPPVSGSGNMASNFMQQLLQSVNNSSAKKSGANSDQQDTKGGFMTLAPKRRLQKALAKMNLLKQNHGSSLNDSSDTLLNDPKSKLSAVSSCSSSTHSSINGCTVSGSGRLYQSQSNPDLTSLNYDGGSDAGGNGGGRLQVNYLNAHIHRPSAASTLTTNSTQSHLLPDYPDHVLKVYKADQTCKYVLIYKETTAHEVVMLTLQEFGIHDPSSNFSLCEVSVGDGGMVKQRRLPDQLQNLAERISFAARYYLKLNDSTEPLVPDELALELVRESNVHFLHLNAYELAIQLTLQDFANFRQIESTEYVDELFELRSRYGVPMLSKFAELVNREMFWVVSEICAEHNIVRRMKIVKQFIKIARHCKECRNFNSMFAIVSGLGHGAVSRLRQTWEKLPSKYQRLFNDLQDLMDPSRNMSKYRQLVSAELLAQHPIIPFYPIVKKDLTFIHLGNDTRVDGLINFEKLRMLAKEVRLLTHMCSSPYDLLSILELKGQSPSNALFSLNQMSASQSNAAAGTVIAANAGQATIKRRKKSTAAPNPKKMFEEAQMVRRVKAYLNSLKILSDEDLLHKFSLECEPAHGSTYSGSISHGNTSHRSGGGGSISGGGGGSSGGGGGGSSSLNAGDQLSIYSHTSSSSAPNSSLSLRKRHPSSPTLSTTSSTSSTSDHQRRQMHNNGPKFGTASPQAVKKMLSLSESSKIRPHQPFVPRHGSTMAGVIPPLHHMHAAHGFSTPSPGGVVTSPATNAVANAQCTPSPSPCSHRRLASGGNIMPSRAIHERSHSDTPAPPPPLPSVDLSLESSSVTTFRDLPLRKSVTSGSISSCDSGYVHQQQQHYHMQYQQQQSSSQHEPSPPVYTAADCRLLQQISNNAVTRNLNSPCQSTNTPPSTPTPPPIQPTATIQLSAPPTAAAYMHVRSQHQQLQQQQQQSLAMPPPPPPPYNVPPLGSLYSHHQGTAGSRHLNHMHGKTTAREMVRPFPDRRPATKQMQSGS